MNPQTLAAARKRVEQVVITQTSLGADWLATCAQARRCYVIGACQARERNLKLSTPFDVSLVEKGITEFVAGVPRLRRFSIHFIFGEVTTAIQRLGHYRRLLASYQVDNAPENN